VDVYICGVVELDSCCVVYVCSDAVVELWRCEVVELYTWSRLDVELLSCGVVCCEVVALLGYIIADALSCLVVKLYRC